MMTINKGEMVAVGTSDEAAMECYVACGMVE